MIDFVWRLTSVLTAIVIRFSLKVTVMIIHNKVIVRFFLYSRHLLKGFDQIGKYIYTHTRHI